MEKISRKLLHSDENLEEEQENGQFKIRYAQNGQLRYMDRYHLDENNQEEVVPRQHFIEN